MEGFIFSTFKLLSEVANTARRRKSLLQGLEDEGRLSSSIMARHTAEANGHWRWASLQKGHESREGCQ